MSKQLGNQGEALAAQYLQQHDYDIIQMNYTCDLGEIDIIALDGDVTCFVEVKTRATDFEHPFESIHARKQSKLIRLAQHYLKEKHGHLDVSARFDVVAVIPKEDSVEIQLLKNAFETRG